MFRYTTNRLLSKNRFVRNVSILSAGTVAGQFIVIAASPILTRLYSPAEFGLLAVYTALLGILAVVASLRYQLAIPIAESDEEAASVAMLSLCIVAVTVVSSALIVFFWGGPITLLLSVSGLEPYLWLLPVGLAMLGTYQVFNSWAIRAKAFPVMARTKLTQALSMVGVQLGAYTLGPLALLLGQAMGQAAGTTTLGLSAIRPSWRVFREVRLANLCRAARRYRRFPIYSSWGGLFNAASTLLPAILFAALFSPAAAGIYMLAQRVIGMPMQMLGNAIADVFFSSATEATRRTTLGSLVTKVHEHLAQIAMPPFLTLAIIGPELFVFVFGEPWRQSGQFAQWLVPYLYMQFVTAPLNTLYCVAEKQKQATVFQGLILIVCIGSISIGAFAQDVIIAVALFSIGSALCLVGFLFWLLSLTESKILLVASLATPKALIPALLVNLPLFVAVFGDWSQGALALAFILSMIALAFRYYSIFRSLFQIR